MAYLYRHVRLDKDEPFYIGIGSDRLYKRAKERTRRNHIWNKIAEKTEFEVEIVLDNLTWEQAKEKEKEFIALYGRKDCGTGTLANLTDGGDGTVGLVVDEEGRMRSSRVHRNKVLSAETKAKISTTLKARPVSQETIERLVNAGLEYSASRRKKVLCVTTGEVFESAEKAAAFFGVSRTYIVRQINGVKKNKFNLIYYN